MDTKKISELDDAPLSIPITPEKRIDYYEISRQVDGGTFTSYKRAAPRVFKALFTQLATSIPIMGWYNGSSSDNTTLINDFSVIPVATYDGVGSYTLTFPGLGSLVEGKVEVEIGKIIMSGEAYSYDPSYGVVVDYGITNPAFHITCYNHAEVLENQKLKNQVITITIYN